MTARSACGLPHIGTLEGHTNSVNVVAVAADGMIYSGSDDGTLRVWSGLNGSPIRTMQMGDAVMTIAIGAGNTVLLSVEGRICSWGGGAAPVRTFYTFDNPASVMAIGHDGRLFIACSGDSFVYEL
jgi:WD40 repeat protein